MAKGVRKVYVVVADNHIFNVSNFMSVEMYRSRDDAERICKLQQAKAMEDAQLLYNVNKPIPRYKVHGFYLIHELYFLIGSK